ncbi:LptF/LptG family permease [Thiovibrio sp. JS02]
MMMKLLDRYLITQFSKNLLLVLCSLLTIYLLVDFFERVDNFLAAKKSVGLAVQYLLLKVPFMYEQLIPVCLLLAGIITLGVLNHHFEFMALMAGGISVVRIIRPLIIAAAFFTLLTVMVGQWVLPPTMTATDRIWYEEVNRQIPKGIIRNGYTYFRGQDGIFSFVRPNPAKNEFRNFTYTGFDAEHGLKTLLTANRASFKDNSWHFKNGQLKERTAEGRFRVKHFRALTYPFGETPDEFFMPEYKIRQLSYSALLAEALASESPGGAAWLEFHRRFSYVFLGIPLLLVGIPVLLMVHKTRGRDLALAIPVSCAMAFAAWGAWSASQSLARTAYLPPGVASWAIHLLAGALGIFLIRHHNR